MYSHVFDKNKHFICDINITLSVCYKLPCIYYSLHLDVYVYIFPLFCQLASTAEFKNAYTLHKTIIHIFVFSIRLSNKRNK